MTEDGQKQYLKWLICKYFPRYVNRIIFKNLKNEHKDLLDVIDNWWVFSLDSIEINNRFPDCVFIAKILYKACQNNEQFFKNLAKTKPNKKKKWDKFLKNDFSNYYALFEFAIRINNLISWITIQGWEVRQREYDLIIKDILTWGYDYVPELKELKELCIKIWVTDFQALYFNKSKYVKEKKRLENRNNFLKKSWKIILWVTTAVWVAMWTIFYKETQKEEKIRITIERMLDDWKAFSHILDNWMFGARDSDGSLLFVYDSPEKKYKFIREKASEILKEFQLLFWKSDDPKNLELLIITEMALYIQKNQTFNSLDWWINFIKYFVSKYRPYLIWLWFQAETNLWIFEKYIKAIQNTLELSKKDFDYYNYYVSSSIWKYIGSDWYEYEIWRKKCEMVSGIWWFPCGIGHIWKTFIFARYFSNKPWNFKLSQQIAEDMLNR